MSAEPAFDYNDDQGLIGIAIAPGAPMDTVGTIDTAGPMHSIGMDPPPDPNGPIADKQQALALCTSLSATACALMEVIDRETEILKGGRPREIATLQSDKIELSALYLAEMTRLKQHASTVAAFAQEEIQALKPVLQELAAKLVENQDALAAILTVSERLIRTAAMNAVAETLPSTYGNGAKITPPPDGRATKFAINKSL
ncbi:MAG: hypothetical protein ACTSY1_01395 [Alphaproteobacteria bacterium]